MKHSPLGFKFYSHVFTQYVSSTCELAPCWLVVTSRYQTFLLQWESLFLLEEECAYKNHGRGEEAIQVEHRNRPSKTDRWAKAERVVS